MSYSYWKEFAPLDEVEAKHFQKYMYMYRVKWIRCLALMLDIQVQIPTAAEKFQVCWIMYTHPWLSP